ncbi:hypothetical protein CGLO_11558 [Colletotrichum gloeosporioides Cg-14]|uniref:Uncharacterized protein n=1 Tax=Colletotrichum gloeosporioides (strain Cg-14) TaxID=1237896 RepID=T0LBK6_COLGC|nr:hypothetical protein CGLO_11558 [Colletotrichum gloeosporioides Cg-14]
MAAFQPSRGSSSSSSQTLVQANPVQWKHLLWDTSTASSKKKKSASVERKETSTQMGYS